MTFILWLWLIESSLVRDVSIQNELAQGIRTTQISSSDTKRSRMASVPSHSTPSPVGVLFRREHPCPAAPSILGMGFPWKSLMI